MHIFETNSECSRRHKINFVDDNNVFVGFDFSQRCCENFDYFFLGEKPNEKKLLVLKNSNSSKEIPNLDGYNFDSNFFEKFEIGDNNFAVFKLKKKKHKHLYLILYNHHNGYYHHGFEFNNIKGLL